LSFTRCLLEALAELINTRSFQKAPNGIPDLGGSTITVYLLKPVRRIPVCVLMFETARRVNPPRRLYSFDPFMLEPVRRIYPPGHLFLFCSPRRFEDEN
jgi:hypothetical protein